MSDQFEWNAEIKFKGTAEEFNKMSALLGDMIEPGRIDIDIPQGQDPSWSGLMPSGPDIRGIDMKALTEGMPRFSLKSLPHIGGGGIPGGIRPPHLHLDKEVVLLDRERFKTFVGEVARELAGRHVDMGKDHVGVMSMINRLAEGL